MKHLIFTFILILATFQLFAQCEVYMPTISNVQCNNNGSTTASAYLTFDINTSSIQAGPSGMYNIIVTPENEMLAVVTPAGPYNYDETVSITLPNGSAGDGDIVIGIEDVDNGVSCSYGLPSITLFPYEHPNVAGTYSERTTQTFIASSEQICALALEVTFFDGTGSSTSGAESITIEIYTDTAPHLGGTFIGSSEPYILTTTGIHHIPFASCVSLTPGLTYAFSILSNDETEIERAVFGGKTVNLYLEGDTYLDETLYPHDICFAIYDVPLAQINDVGNCAAPTCFDGMMNGDETDVDCGGANCDACPTCNDGMMNGDETGVDCGGATCDACPTCEVYMPTISNVQCNNNGSTTADAYLTFDINTSSIQAGPSGMYNIIVTPENEMLAVVTPAGPYNYDETVSITLPDGSAGAGDIVIGIEDVDNGVNCSYGLPSITLFPYEHGNVAGTYSERTTQTFIATAEQICALALEVTFFDGTGSSTSGAESITIEIYTDTAPHLGGTLIGSSEPYILTTRGIHHIPFASCVSLTPGLTYAFSILSNDETEIERAVFGGKTVNTYLEGDIYLDESLYTSFDICFAMYDVPLAQINDVGNCAAPTCDDGMMNGDETGVDCGGATCDACVTCDDGIMNGDETDVDCGGATCDACPTCDDGIKNGDETGVDCGGANCDACICDNNKVFVYLNFDDFAGETGWEIRDENDELVIVSGLNNYVNGMVTTAEEVCILNGCYNFRITDTYGDGICCSYGDGSYLVTDGDGNEIASGGFFSYEEITPFCVNGTTCDDGILNGDETDVDCGGTACDACPTCDDGMMNGDETDVDCGGATCDACPTCDDGMMNGDETDVDCGGTNCDACPTCEMATGLAELNLTDVSVTLTWDAQDLAQSYKVVGRRVNGPSKSFETTESTMDFYLLPNRTYEWTVKVLCDGVWTDYPEIREFTTLPASGKNVPLFDIFDDVENTLTSTIYPNPTANEVNVTFMNATQNKVQINVLDITGRIVMTQNVQSDIWETEVRLDISDLQNGYYFVEVNDGTTSTISKLNVIK